MTYHPYISVAIPADYGIRPDWVWTHMRCLNASLARDTFATREEAIARAQWTLDHTELRTCGIPTAIVAEG